MRIEHVEEAQKKLLKLEDELCRPPASEKLPAEYAFGLIENVLDKEVRSIPHAHRNEFVGVLRKGNFRMYQPFVTCFCESGDLPSQWRGYGSGGEGFALGLKMSWLSSLERIGFAVRRVVYERRRQWQLISEYLRGALDLVARYDFSTDDRKWFWGHAAVPIAEVGGTSLNVAARPIMGR